LRGVWSGRRTIASLASADQDRTPGGGALHIA